MKNPAYLYEVSFFSALWIVFPESWKRSCPNFYAHDCIPLFGSLEYFQLSNNLAQGPLFGPCLAGRVKCFENLQPGGSKISKINK